MPQEIIPFLGGNSINLQKIQGTQILKKKRNRTENSNFDVR